MLNENILDEQINIELNRVNEKKHNKILQNNKFRKNKKSRLKEVNETRLSIDTDITSINLKENNNNDDINNNITSNEMNEMNENNEINKINGIREIKKNNDETDNETDDEIDHNVNNKIVHNYNDAINLDDIRRKLIYQLQRTI